MSIVRFGLFWIRKLLLIGVLLIVVVMVFVSFDNFNQHPNDITQEFLQITENPTQVLSSSEKRTLKRITESNFLNNISYQNLIKGLRKVHMEAVRREIEVQVEPNKVYSTSNIQYFDSENNVIAEVKLFMETSKKWYVLKQTKIFHIQIDTKTSFIDQESYDNINKNLDKVREDVMDGFEDFKDRFKLSF